MVSSQEPILNIVGEKVALGPLISDHLPHFSRWFNDLEVMRTYSFHRIADFNIIIGKKRYWGQGIGTEATKLT